MTEFNENCCPLNMHPEVVRIPVRRILEKIDAMADREETDSAEKLMKYWISEAEAGHDPNGKLSMLSEQIGFYRKHGREKECIEAIETALSVLKELKLDETVSGATIMLNAATGYKAFEKPEESISIFRKVQSVYENNLEADDRRMAGLYNNMALTLTDLKEYDEAQELYEKALSVLSQNRNTETDMAITYLNLADLVNDRIGAEAGEKQIEEYIDRAESLLDTETLPQDGYYAYVCEKCAPVFDHYGYFLTKQKLEKRAGKIRQQINRKQPQ